MQVSFVTLNIAASVTVVPTVQPELQELGDKVVVRDCVLHALAMSGPAIEASPIVTKRKTKETISVFLTFVEFRD